MVIRSDSLGGSMMHMYGQQVLLKSRTNEAVDAVAQAAFNEKKWLWVEDSQEGFIAGYVTSERKGPNGDEYEVYLNNGKVRTVNANDTQKMNPPKFDKMEDMAELSILNEASVTHNLRMRYQDNLIYTYSGLFLVALNPYRKLPIYSDSVVQSYKNKRRGEMPPHIYAVTDLAYHDMLQDKENQTILITGESGAGKTENTKKSIQYLASIALDKFASSATSTRDGGKLEKQILEANPILEAFGNAQTIRNNNSSRFGKFIRIEFSSSGQIAGGNIQWYLLEKSRVAFQAPDERNYHIFYQLMNSHRSESKDNFKQELLLDGDCSDYRFLRSGARFIEGVDDAQEYNVLKNAMNIMGFSRKEQLDFLRVVAAILHLGNITVTADRSDQVQLPDIRPIERACHVLGIPVQEFMKGLLRPKILAGRDWVAKAQSKTQVMYSIEALAKALYERSFGKLVDRINKAIDQARTSHSSNFIGVLDIAGFEIFEVNSFEQLCINYTNERLQQFFNHNMFTLEQEEYRKEGIDWKFRDFGLHLQPTIDLIDKNNPVGILSCLDEECLIGSSDDAFMNKLNTLWKGKSEKYEPVRFKKGFILHHYAAKVEYSTEGWLKKNKDPLNETVTRLFATSSEPYIASLFEDYLEADAISDSAISRTRMMRIGGGSFRTVGQRHKEQLNSLMETLANTTPHFVRCIIPNTEKKPGKYQIPLVLEQLRCNGVLEGIRICRDGFPNRLPYAEFKKRYEILCADALPPGYIDGREAAKILLTALDLDENQYRLGTAKVFFRVGVLADLEDIRDQKLASIFTGIQAHARGHSARRKIQRRAAQSEMIRVIQKNARKYIELKEWPWWKLYLRIKPLTTANRADNEIRKKEQEKKAVQAELDKVRQEKQYLEQQHMDLGREKKTIEEQFMSELRMAADEKDILQRSLNQAQAKTKDLEQEIETLAAELEGVEDERDQLVLSNKQFELRVTELSADLEESQQITASLQQELAQKTDEYNTLLNDKEKEVSKALNLSELEMALQKTIIDLRDALNQKEVELTSTVTRLQDQISELQEQLTKEKTQHRELQDTHHSILTQSKADTEKHATELRDLKSQSSEKVSELRKLQAELSQANVNAEKTKNRLEGELSDLRLELERKQVAWRASAKICGQAQADLAKSQKETEHERSLRERVDADLMQAKEDLRKLRRDLHDACEELEESNNGKKAIEQELSIVSSTFGDDIRSVHDLGKVKQDWETRLKALENELAEEKSKLAISEKARCKAERELAEEQERLEDLFTQKEGTFEETKLILMKEVQDLGEKLEVERAAKEDAQSLLRRLTKEISGIVGSYDV
ncbi:hypothetical protein BZG36_02720 [Bifiguratus adelaidae]|uniref:Myosin motor domain-containing protein n=1 Tax=Bifiguratus adelaidae TaxID=1938954 RepID=A0A261Y1R9_9FUNG|nr:hypothetical protein BZG36_02720 [Bifiguratus adelaidae]